MSRDEQPDLFGDEKTSQEKIPKHWSIQWVDYLIQHKLLTPLLLGLMYLQLSGKIDIAQIVTKRPFRLDVDNAEIMQDKKLIPLTDLLRQHKIILQDGYLYSYDEGDNILELLEEIKKYAARSVSSAPEISKKIQPQAKAKPRAVVKTKKKKAQEEESIRKIIRELQENQED